MSYGYGCYRYEIFENIKDEAANPLDIQKGCAFKNRCKYAMKICESERPKLKSVSKGHQIACHLK